MSVQNKSNPVLPDPASASPGRRFTYEDLWPFHKTDLVARLESEGKALNLVNNHFSSMKRWLELASWLKLDGKPGSATFYNEVGDELSTRFDECLKQFLDDLKAQGYQSTKDPKSHLTKIQQSWFLLLRSEGLPKDFLGALNALLQRSGKTRAAVARAVEMSYHSLRAWSEGTYKPVAKRLNKIPLLESYFKVQSGTLRSRLPMLIQGSQKRLNKNTPYRFHLIEMREKKYYLPELTPLLQKEFDHLRRFFTDGVWVVRQNLKRGGPGWRVNQKTGECPTADIKLSYISGFMGFLCLPADSPDPHLRGKGFKPEDLSLALLADVDLVYDFIEFYKGRVVNHVYNSYTANFLAFCEQLTHPKTGYLTQYPHYSQRLPAFLEHARGAQTGKDSRN